MTKYDIAVIIFLAVCVFAAVFSVIKRRKSGAVCCGDCEKCGKCTENKIAEK